MDVFVIFFAIFMAGIGLFVKKYPNMISGYNTMSKEKLKNVDLQAVGTLFYKGFLLIGVSMVVLYFFFRLLGMPLVAQIVWLAPLFVITPVLLLKAQKYDSNRRSNFMKYLPAGIVIVLFVGTSILLAAGLQPTKAVVDANSVRFTGQYGVTVPFREITKCGLLEQIPRIGLKINGFAIAGTCKGDFRLNEWGNCRLFLKSSKSPYLYMELTDGKKIIFNSTDPACTQDLFEKLSDKVPAL